VTEIEFSAKYYDGESSRGIDVRVRLDAANMVHVIGLDAPLEVPLANVRVAPRLGNTVRSIAFPDGAKCETEDNDAADALLRRSGTGRFGDLLHRIESRSRYALAAALGLAAFVVVGVVWGIPIAAKVIAHTIPDEAAYDIGRGTLATLDKTLLDPSELPEERRRELEATFNGMANRYPDLPLTLVFRRGVGPNAFALPDGTVIVTDELVELATDDRQILAVLAHEIGHVHHRHGLRMALESSSIALLVSAYFGDIAQITTLSASLPGVYANAHYSRDHETEADTFALEYLKGAGVAPHHFADILRALSEAAGNAAERTPLRYLASHPPTEDRVRRFDSEK